MSAFSSFKWMSVSQWKQTCLSNTGNILQLFIVMGIDIAIWLAQLVCLWICKLEMTGLIINIVWISAIYKYKYSGDGRISHDDKGKMKVTYSSFCFVFIWRISNIQISQPCRHQWPLCPPPGPLRWVGTDRERRGEFTHSSVSPHTDVWECLGSALPDRGALAPVRCSPHTIPIPLPLDLDSLSPCPSRQSGVKG